MPDPNAVNPARQTRELRARPFSSVSVCCGTGACATARALAGKRHLVAEAPQLPLPECSVQTCDCRLFTYGDRRSLLNNRRTYGAGSARRGGWPWSKNRRAGQERRKVNIDFRRWA